MRGWPIPSFSRQKVLSSTAKIFEDKYLTLSFEVIIFEKSKETTFSGSKTICSGVVPLLGVWGLCIGMGDPNENERMAHPLFFASKSSLLNGKNI